MARTRSRTPVPESNSLIASAVRYPPVSQPTAGRRQQWQAQAWEYYDRIGELRFVANWVGNVMSRAALVVAKDINGTLVVQHKGPAVEALEAYYGGFQGQSAMLHQVGVHLTVAGEMWQVATSDEDWYSLAYNKVSIANKDIRVDLGDGKRRPIGAKEFAIRVWTPHPNEPMLADSPVRSNLGTLAEIASLNAHVRAQLTSRLAGAGILMLPAEITFPVPKSAAPGASQADAFMSVLAEAMMTPIQDPESASAVVPIVVTAPGEFLGEVKHVTFWTDLDEKVVSMRENAVKRLALGLDTPPEVLLGVSETNHWNAWLVDDAAIKSHLEPRLGVLCQAITTTYLRPAIIGQEDEPDDFYVLADTSDIRMRPNRSKEAIELHDRGVLSDEALRRETGFKPEDALVGNEHREWLLRKIATGSTSPEQTQAAMRLLGADLGPLQIDGDNAPPPDHMRTDIKPDDSATRNQAPAIERAKKNADLLSASDVLVFRALERVGNRLANGHNRSELADVATHWRYLEAEVIPDNALDGCWAFASEVLEGKCASALLAAGALDGYVRYLLDNRVRHNRDLMESRLAQAGL